MDGLNYEEFVTSGLLSERSYFYKIFLVQTQIPTPGRGLNSESQKQLAHSIVETENT